MKPVLMTVLATAALVFAPAVLSQHSHTKKHIEEDIKRHLAMAQAHQAAAQCLKDGRDYKVCQEELQAACKGLALGRYCGMRHSH